jgi:heat shock protein HtpX
MESSVHAEMSRNRRRAGMLLAASAAVVLVVLGALAAVLGFGRPGVAVALVVAVAAAVAAYLFSDRVALGLSGARQVSADEEPRFHNLVEGLCIAAGLPKPDLYLVDDAAPNAFSAGRSPAHASLAVTRGLLQKLSRVELEGVLAHELSHIRRGDIVVTTPAVILVGVALRPLLGLVVPSRRETQADVSGVRLTRYPPGLIAALEKLRADGTTVQAGSPATAHLWLEWPGSRTHPPLEERISALKEL